MNASRTSLCDTEKETHNQTGDTAVNAALRQQVTGGETTISHSSAAKAKVKVLSGEDP